MTIPLIDISSFLDGDGAGQRAVGQAVDRALREIGFIAITGHGVDPDVVRAMTRASHAFFDLPLEEKMKSANRQAGIGRGYIPYAGESNGRTTDARAAPDAKEQIAFGRFDRPAIAGDPEWAKVAYQPNLLPAQPPDFAAAARAYYAAMEALAARVLRVFAVALALPHDFFVDKFDHHASVMRVLLYPDQSSLVLEPGQLRSGEHTDFGSLTLLLADHAPGGLQVKLRHGGWIDVLPPAGSFVVNIGDLLAVWTNDRWISNMHRVANPPARPGESTKRLSIAYFAHANYDALVECIATCADAANPPRHPPVLAGEHRLMKVRLASQTPYGQAS